MNLKKKSQIIIRKMSTNSKHLAVIFMLIGHFLTKGDIFTLAGFVLFGLGCAPIFPAMLHETPSKTTLQWMQ